MMYISFTKARSKYSIGYDTIKYLIGKYNITNKAGYVYYPSPFLSKFAKKQKKKATLIDEQALIQALSLENISPRSYTH